MSRPRQLASVMAAMRRAPYVLWLVLAVSVLILVAAGAPDAYRQHPAVCHAGQAGCEPMDESDRAELDDAGIRPTQLAAYDGLGIPALTIVAFAGLSALLVWRRPRDPFAVFCSCTLLLFGTVVQGGPTEALVIAHSGFELPVQVLELAGQVSFAALFYLFPDGRWVPRWTPWLLVPVAVLFGIDVFAPGSALDLFDGPVFLLFLASLLGAQVHRYRKVSDPVARQQTKWVFFGSCAAIGIFSVFLAIGLADPDLVESVLGLTALRTVMFAALALLPASIAMAILRHRLWDIDLVINRALVWTTLSACGIGIYLLAVAAVRAIVPTGSGATSLVAAAVVAVTFAPLRVRIQAAANRLLYGDRDEPHRVVSRLGERLEATLAPDAMAHTIVETVHDALRVPYVALEAIRDGVTTPIASVGEPAAAPTRVPLTYAGAEIGSLVVSPRPGERTLGPSDLRVLQDLSRHAGLAVQALHLRDEAFRLSTDLHRSRQQLVTAREEERRRLRRDLHDGLGPQLASVVLKAEIVREMVPPDLHGGVDLLDQVIGQAEESVAEVRRLVEGLRPPALDDLSLVGAIRAVASQLDGNDIEIDVDGPDSTPPLPAAVEVAAYRIVQEALHNAVRHSSASRVSVELRLDGAMLEVSVRDNGCGITAYHASGVGLRSMAERAAELGGDFEIVTVDAGAHVRARLPVEQP